MTDDRNNSRQQRLRTALRENLKRRKSQIRARSAAATKPGSVTDPDEIPHDNHEDTGGPPNRGS